MTHDEYVDGNDDGDDDNYVDMMMMRRVLIDNDEDDDGEEKEDAEKRNTLRIVNANEVTLKHCFRKFFVPPSSSIPSMHPFFASS